MIIALIAGGALLLLVMHRLGDLVPAIIMLGSAAFTVFVLPGFPGSPVAFLADPHAHPSQSQIGWLAALAFAGPLVLAVLYKELRGDRRGTAGRRLP